MEYALRRASMDDMDMLFSWANDTTVRKNSFHSEPIPYEEHVRWFHNMMESDDAFQYIFVETDGSESKDIGQIRLNINSDSDFDSDIDSDIDAEEARAYIGYSIAGEYRGRGLAAVMLDLIKDEAAHVLKQKGISRLIGQVKPENKASLKAFERAGFEKSVKDGHIEYEYRL